MKKIVTFIFVFTLLITKSNIYGQEFLGIKVGGKLSEVVAKFKLKGFKVTSPDNLNPILTGKAGVSNVEVIIFSSPYKEGEGDEMNAITMEKCHYSAYWENVSIEISEYKQVKIAYENAKNFEIRDAEVAKLKKETF